MSKTIGQLWNSPDLEAVLANFPFTIFLYGSDKKTAKQWVEKTFKGKVQILKSLEENRDDNQKLFVVSSQILENYEVSERHRIYDFVNKGVEFVQTRKDGTSTTIKKGQTRIILNYGRHQELDFEDFLKQIHSQLGWDEIGTLNIPVYSTCEVYNCI